MTGTVRRAASPLVENLRGRDVFVADQSLHLADIYRAVLEQCGIGDAQQTRRIDAALTLLWAHLNQIVSTVKTLPLRHHR